jgi:hypothetical protein
MGTTILGAVLMALAVLMAANASIATDCLMVLLFYMFCYVKCCCFDFCAV